MKTNYLFYIILLFLMVIGSSNLLAQSGSSAIKKEKFYFDKVSEDEVGYAMAVKVGNTIYISGYNSGGDPATQINNVYEGLLKVLESYGLTYENVVKENLYAIDLESIILHKDVRKKFYKGDYPAATWVEVKQLYDKSLKLEVELIAVMP